MFTRRVSRIWLLLGPFCAAIPPNANAGEEQLISSVVLYVDHNASGLNDGSSWENAFDDLQSALDAAEAIGDVVEVRVAEGTYKPTKRTEPDDPRSATFTLPPGVLLYGGFSADDSFSERNWYSHPTVLSGDILGDDLPGFLNRTDNVYHVLIHHDESDGDATLLDGFGVRGGHSDGELDSFGAALRSDGDIVLQNCFFTDNWSGATASEGTVAHSDGGGAVAAMHIGRKHKEPYIVWSGCSFEDNAGSGNAGAVLLNNASITLSWCSFQDNVARRSGGIDAGCIGSLALHDCYFLFNRAGGEFGGYSVRGAGALFVQCDADRLEVLNSYFGANHGANGGAIAIDDGNYAYDVSIDSCQFHGNSALVSAGALYLNYLSLEINNSEFFENEAGQAGGAAVLTEGVGLVRDSVFFLNVGVDGGAIHASRGTVFVEDSSLWGNHASVGGAISNDDARLASQHSYFNSNSATVGGAIAATGGHPSIQIFDSQLTDNQAELYGGAIAGAIGELLVQRSTVAGNSAGALGAAMIGGQEIVIRDSIIWQNTVDTGGLSLQDETAQIEGLGSASINYSIIQGWTGLFGGQGNSGLDPLFGDENYRLSPSSPAANAGDPGFIAAYGDTDLDGNPRVLCGRVDMGAYESGIGDFDCDGVVGLIDVAGWVACAEGSSEGSDCAAMDFDNDGDFDLKDFAGIQQTIGE